MGRALAVIIWILTLLSVVLFVSKKWWFPPSISAHGPALDRQFMITIVVVGIAFAAAQVGLGWMVWKYRDASNRPAATYTHGSSRLEVLWTVITAIIFIGLAVMGQSVWASLRFNAAPAGSYQIEVVAQQFEWNFHYPGKDKIFGRTDPGNIDESVQNIIGLDNTDPNAVDDQVGKLLAVPVGRPVELILRSKDVIHSFWVPPLRFKQDLVPGMAIRVHFTANKVGKYELACAELCGQSHYNMKSVMLVLPEDEFRALTELPPGKAFIDRMTELRDKYKLPEEQ
jgi:cytochrome c oxidase subunit 2